MRKERLKRAATQNQCITEGIAVRADYNLMSVFWEGAPWQKRKRLIVTYEYMVNGQRRYKDIKFVCPKEEDGTFHAQFPYKIRIYYDTKKSKILHWEKDEVFDNVVKKE